MAFTDLRDFLARLEKDGRLRRVTAPAEWRCSAGSSL